MAEDGMDAERAARLFGENVVNALVDAIEKRMKTEDDDDREDRFAATQHRLDITCGIVDGISRKLDSFEAQVSTCAEVVKAVGDPRLAMRRNVEAFVTQMEDRVGEKVDRLDKLVRSVCDRLDQQGQLLATAAEGVGYAKAECMRLDEVARQQSERIDVNVCHSTDKNSDLVRRVVRLERDLEALEIVAFKGSPVIGPSWQSMIGTMAGRIDGLSKSVGEVERAIENRADPDRFAFGFEHLASTELAAGNEAADRRDRDSDAGWRSKNGVRPGDMIGLGSFIPKASPDPTTSSIEQRNAALELAHAEIRRLTMALERVKAKMYEEGRTHQTTLADAHALRNQITAIDKDRTELRAEIRRLVEANGAALVERAPIAFTMPPVDVPPEFERGYNAGLKRGLAELEDLRGQMSIIDHDRVGLSMDHTEQLEWRKTAEEVVRRASALIVLYASEGDKHVFRVPTSPQIAARMSLAEAIELHEKACSERARDLPF